jgi:hypothetical protein
MSQSNQAQGSGQGSERRRSKRRPILDTFSLFVVVPRKGVHRLRIHDVSNQGLGFDLDIDGESLEEFQIKPKEKLEVHLYLNQSLYLSLNVQVARLQDAQGIRQVGAEFTEQASPGYKAFAAFLQMLDLVSDAAQIV